MAILSLNQSKSPVAEAYRTLRTNIKFVSFEKHIKAIAVTSAWINEGKSTVTVNLGITMARAGSRVLVIDGDLRNPTIHRDLSLINNMGITNILAEDSFYKDIIINHPEIDNFHILLCGPKPPNPSELLGSTKMKNFLEELKLEYDYILIDTPPAAVVTDAAVIASACDGVLLVVSSGETVINNALKAKELLQNVNANILGAVLNKVKLDKSMDYYGYNYYGSLGREKKSRRLNKSRRGLYV